MDSDQIQRALIGLYGVVSFLYKCVVYDVRLTKSRKKRTTAGKNKRVN